MNQPIRRRNALQVIASSCAAAQVNLWNLPGTQGSSSTQASSPTGGEGSLLNSTSSVISNENSLAGDTTWLPSHTRIDPKTKFRCPWVEGYASHASIQPGETLDLMISTEPKAQVLIDVYRMGYYNGSGGRRVAQLGPIPCTQQPTPEAGELRLMDCDWEPSAKLLIGKGWVSGVYVAKLTELNERLESYIVFVVRDERKADLVYQASDHTWQAYNRWPSQFSLYDDGQNEWHWGRKAMVSFNRPYGKYCQILDAPLSIGTGEFFLWEFPFVYWLEREGYDVTYVSNTDTHRDKATAARGKGFLSVGHDEYWTIEMFRNVQSAIASGVSVGFFSGNAVCGRVAWEESTRSIQRVGVFGPPGGTHEFESMSSLLHERPYANELIGAHSTGPVTGGADWICTRPDHWLYENTGMKLGDRIEGLIGWEYHGDPAPIPGLEIVAEGPTQSAPGKLNGGHYTATVYPGPQGNIVFNASTCWWVDGLSAPPGYQSPKVYTAPQGVDARVQRMTRNVLNRMIRS
ncbi:N,N-dimethylformamidase beta subunit family domain-containing protein [Pirellulaceae bacterium SH449]